MTLSENVYYCDRLNLFRDKKENKQKMTKTFTVCYFRPSSWDEKKGEKLFPSFFKVRSFILTFKNTFISFRVFLFTFFLNFRSKVLSHVPM